MVRFIRTIIYFLLPFSLLPFIYMAFYRISIPNDKNICYIWGDSQMFQGLDLDYLNHHSQFKFLSSAQHGSGIYDFLAFSNLIPRNSLVIISISRPVLIRPKQRDGNFSALDLSSLYLLVKNNYSVIDVLEIFLKNVKPHQFFNTSSSLIHSKDRVIRKVDPQKKGFEAMYKAKPPYFDDKRNLYFEGLKILKNKNCKIIALVFPFHPELQEIENKSPFYKDLVEFDDEISLIFEKKEIISLDTCENNFADFTHLNSRGAFIISQELIKFLNSPARSQYIQLKLEGVH